MLGSFTNPFAKSWLTVHEEIAIKILIATESQYLSALYHLMLNFNCDNHIFSQYEITSHISMQPNIASALILKGLNQQKRYLDRKNERKIAG